ncbi:MAG: TonB-dependent siderophore receptor [Bryobacteraceae bacterium]
MASKRIKRKTIVRKKLTGGRYWVAMGTLAAYGAVGSGKLALAQQGTPGGSASSKGEIQGLPERRYAIAAGDLSTVIGEFEKVAGVHVEAGDRALLDVASPGVTGVFTVEEALKKVLAGTGLSYAFRGTSSVVLQVATQKTSVDVNATAPAILESSMPKYQAPLIDTPQTITVVPQQTMAQQGDTTLRDALRNVAGISLAAGEGGSQGDNLTIRGFTARNDLFIDGMRDFGSYYRDPFNTQEVEVLQGPSSVTFGRGSTGGVVNQASKTPDLNQFINVGLEFGTDDTRRATIDLNAPVPLFGSTAAFRLNAMGDIGDVAGRDVAENRRDGFAPSLSFGLGTPTRLSLSYVHQNEDDVPDYGIPWLFNNPAPVNRSEYYGLQDGNFLRTYDDIGTARLEHDINSKVMIRDQVRYANYVRDVVITEPQLTGITFGTPLSAMQVTRHEIGVNSTETYLDEQLDLTARFKTGFMKHTFVTGIEAGRETSDPSRPAFTAPTTSLLNPNPDQQLNPNPTITTRVNDSAVSLGAYAIDTISLGQKFDLTGGLRFDRFDDTYSQFVPPATHFERVDQMPTWRAAAVYKPISIGSIYFDAGTSFNPSAETLSLSAGTANLPPEKNLTYEFGTKWGVRNNRLTINSSWFRTTKANAREQDPANTLLYVLAGNQRVSGVEADIRGHVTSRWEMLSSYAYMDSRVVSSQYYPGAIGYPLANVPKNSFNFWSAYHLPHHFEFGAGANYESSRTASSTVPLDPTTGLIKEVPGYWVFNAMASHPLGEHIDVQVNAYNLANRYYYDEIHPGHIVLGPGRSALIGFKFKF